MAELIAPDVRVRGSFLSAMAEFAAEGRVGDSSMVGSDLATYAETWQSPDGFAAYVAATRAAALEETARPAGFVPSTTLWWVEGDEYVGRIAIRHRLNAKLLELGGHIGYDVRRTRRREGHATAMLLAALRRAHALGIDAALLTCAATNVGSRKVIEACGGTFEDQRGGNLRFWVPTTG